MNELTYLVTTANNKDILYDPVSSHAATHFADTPQLKSLAKEILSQSLLEGRTLLFEHDMGRIVGNTDLVTNGVGDEIVFAKRKNRNTFTSFNKSKTSQPCSLVTLALESINENQYELVSAWVGTVQSPPFPGDKAEKPESKDYWLSHSLAWGTQEIQEGSETPDCPW